MKNVEKTESVSVNTEKNANKKKKMKFLASVGLVTILTGIIYLVNIFRKSFQQLFLDDDTDDWNISEDDEA